LLKKGVHDFEPTSIEEDPEAVETGERTGVVNVGVTPNRNEPAQAFADERVASNYHFKELLNSLIVSDYEVRRGVRVNGVIPDFVVGIKSTLQGSLRSGGTSPSVQRMIRNDPDKIMDLHNMVYNFVLSKHLASKKLQTEDGRRRLSQSLVSSYLQGTEFEQPRRLRGKEGNVKGFGDVATGEEGAGFDPAASAAIKGVDAKRKRGEAIFSKNLQQIRQSLSQMEKRIVDQEAVAPKIEKGESLESSKAKLDKIMQTVKEKAEFFDVIKDGLIEQIKMTPKEADDWIKSWQEAEADPNRPEITLDKVKEAFMGMLQSVNTGEEMQIARPEPAKKVVFTGSKKPVSFSRPEMASAGPSPLLRRKPATPTAIPQVNIPPQEDLPKTEWNRLSISERVNYFKNRLKK